MITGEKRKTVAIKEKVDSNGIKSLGYVYRDYFALGLALFQFSGNICFFFCADNKSKHKPNKKNNHGINYTPFVPKMFKHFLPSFRNIGLYVFIRKLLYKLNISENKEVVKLKCQLLYQ